jgi:hypothetical protein
MRVVPRSIDQVHQLLQALAPVFEQPGADVFGRRRESIGDELGCCGRIVDDVENAQRRAELRGQDARVLESGVRRGTEIGWDQDDEQRLCQNVSSRIFKNACESIRTGHGDRGISHREPRDLSRPRDALFSSATKLTRESHDAIACVERYGC